MTHWYRSLRVRVALALLLASILPSIVLATVVDASIMSAGVAQLRDQATTELSSAVAIFDYTDELAANTVRDSAAIPSALLDHLSAQKGATWFDGHEMWAGRRLSDGSVLALRLPAESLLNDRTHIRGALVVSTIAVGLAACGLGWLIAGSLTARLRRAAKAVADGEFTHDGIAIEPPPQRDEVDELVQRITALTGDLQTRLEREQAFTADVAHELRTPLTALIGAAELLPPGKEATRVQRLTARLRALIEDLLELGRAEQGGVIELESVDIGREVADLYGDDPRVAISSTGSWVAVTDRTRILTIVSNLVSNAIAHGAPPVALLVSPGRIEVTDAGAGYPESLLTDGPQRFSAHSRTSAVGLGLTIASAWAQRLGGTLTLSNTDHGARAIFALPLDSREPLPNC